MKMFVIPCDVNGQKVPVQFYIGEPAPNLHPIKYQSSWISMQRGVTVPADVLGSLQKLFEIAVENKVSFVDLCTYALNYPTEQNAPAASPSNDPSSPSEETPTVEEPLNRRKWVTTVSDDAAASTPPAGSETNLAHEDVVLLLSGFNNAGDQIYNYLKLELKDVEKLVKNVESGGRFDVRQYGEVIAAGLGVPTEEVKREVESKYKMITFPKQGN